MCGFADRRRVEAGRPEGLPHTAAIKRNGGEFCHSCHLTVRIYFFRAAKPYRQLLWRRVEYRCRLWASQPGCRTPFRSSRRRGFATFSHETLAGWAFGNVLGNRWQQIRGASHPSGSKLPRHKGCFPTWFSDVKIKRSQPSAAPTWVAGMFRNYEAPNVRGFFWRARAIARYGCCASARRVPRR